MACFQFKIMLMCGEELLYQTLEKDYVILLMNLIVNFMLLNQVKQCASGCFVLEWNKSKAAATSQVYKKV